MTTSKSTLNSHFYTFRTTLASNFLLPLLNALALSFFFPVMNWTILKNADSNHSGAASDLTLKETYRYVLFDNESIVLIFAILSTVVCSVLLGVMAFRFIASKKTVNVYYSLGITRNALFSSKYLAGIMLLVVSVALPMLLNLIVNFIYFGSSWQLWSATLYYFWSFSILACFAFTVTAAVFSCVGTVAEGCVFPLTILGAPTIILYCLQYLMETLFGNPYGHYFPSESLSSLAGLPDTYQAFNPLLFLYQGLRNLGALDAEGKLVPNLYSSGDMSWTKPNFLPLVFWTAAVAAVMLVGMYLFKKRKAEICGFLGANPVLNFFITFLIGLFGFGLSIRFLAEKLSMALAVLIGLIVYTVIYCIIDFALIRNGKEFLRGLRKLPIHLIIMLGIGVVFATGLFGYSSRIPELAEIKSVAVTSPTNLFNGLPNNGSSIDNSDFSWGASGGMQGNITGEENIRFVQTLHEQIIKDGRQQITADQEGIAREDQMVRGQVQVVYELKNGKKMLRYYETVRMKVVNQMLEVEDTAAGRERIQALLTKPFKSDDMSYYLANAIQEKGSIILISPFMDRETPVTFSESQRKALLQCIADDLTTQKASQRYFPTEALIGLINIQDGEMFSYHEESDSNRAPISDAFRGYTVYLTKDMPKTIQFLQSAGVYGSFGNPAAAESVEIVRAKGPSSDANRYASSNLGVMYSSNFFIGYWRSAQTFAKDQARQLEYERDGYPSDDVFKNAVALQDAKQAQEIASLSHVAYFYGVDGYFVRVKLADEKGYTCMFLPESAAPQYLKDAVG